MNVKRISGSTEGLSEEVSEEYFAKKAQSTAGKQTTNLNWIRIDF